MGSIADHGPFTGLTLWVHEEKFWPKKAGAKSSMVRVRRRYQHPRKFSQKLRHVKVGLSRYRRIDASAISLGRKVARKSQSESRLLMDSLNIHLHRSSERISSGEFTNGGNQLPPQCPIGPLQSSGTVLRLL
ncbi:hypothetical protein SDJN03_01942, partial [Cucurbita argyrosperma subsp. sororia]